MKKVISLLCILVLAIGLAGCGKDTEDVLHLGLNAEIVEIDTANQIIYVDYDTSEVSDIKFSDL